MYKKLKSFLNSIHKLDDGLFEEYISHWNNHFVPKKTIITPPDSTEKYTYLVMDGIQKSYFIKDDKKYNLQTENPHSPVLKLVNKNSVWESEGVINWQELL